MAVGIRHADTLCPQKLALNSQTSGGGSVGIMHSRTEAMEFSVEILSRPLPSQIFSVYVFPLMSDKFHTHAKVQQNYIVISIKQEFIKRA
jgi:hypothetical protein